MSRTGDVVLWMPYSAPWRPHPSPESLCCDALRAALDFDSDGRATPFDSETTPIVYNAVFDEFGLILRSEEAQYLLIGHCPWCGAALPESRRDAWFDALEEQGFLDPNHDAVPEAYLSDHWRRAR